MESKKWNILNHTFLKLLNFLMIKKMLLSKMKELPSSSKPTNGLERMLSPLCLGNLKKTLKNKSILFGIHMTKLSSWKHPKVKKKLIKVMVKRKRKLMLMIFHKLLMYLKSSTKNGLKVFYKLQSGVKK